MAQQSWRVQRIWMIAALLLAFATSLPVASATAGGKAQLPTVMSCGTAPLFLESGLITKGTIHYVSHPRYCNYSVDGSEAGRVNLERLHWRHWGAPRATASGLLKDNHDQDENGFQRHPVRIVVYHKVQWRPYEKRTYYSRMHIRGVRAASSACTSPAASRSYQ